MKNNTSNVSNQCPYSIFSLSKDETSLDPDKDEVNDKMNEEDQDEISIHLSNNMSLDSSDFFDQHPSCD